MILVENRHSHMKSYTQDTKGNKQQYVNSDCSLNILISAEALKM